MMRYYIRSEKVSRNKKPISLVGVIAWWIIAIILIVFDLLFLLPEGRLDWWQIAITLLAIGNAIHTTIKYRKEKVEDGGNEE